MTYTKIAQEIILELENRLLQKKNLDNLTTLSQDTTSDKVSMTVEKVNDNQGYMTLLSEGSILYGDGTIRMFIAKGTLTKWYESLSDDFEGYVTTGHCDLSAEPVREGYFTKKDLKLVYDSNGRADLLVKPYINTKLSRIQDLILQGEPFAISSEFFAYEMEITDEVIPQLASLINYNVEQGGGVEFPVTDKVDIKGFSFVASPGNAKSGGYDPNILLRNEEEQLKNKETLDKVLAHLQSKHSKETETVEQIESLQSENAEEVSEQVEQATENVEDVETNKSIEEALSNATELIESLQAENAKLKQENKELKSLNSSYKQEEQSIAEKLTQLNSLLSKTNVKVETATVEKTGQPVNRFGRKRFNGE